jgi:hypothetical protein
MIEFIQKLREFRDTDVLYQGAGGYQLAQKEFGKNLKVDVLDPPNKIYVQYLDESFKNRREMRKTYFKQRQEEIAKSEAKFPGEYQKLKDNINNVKLDFYKLGVYVGHLPKHLKEQAKETHAQAQQARSYETIREQFHEENKQYV